MTIPSLKFGLLIAALCGWGLARRGLKRLRGTTLTNAAKLLEVGVLAWMLAMMGNVASVIPPGVVETVRYGAILLLLGAGISVLGARKPGNEPWRWFVVLPMFLVLGWPVLLCLGREWIPKHLDLTSPAAIGVLLVICMSAGNYLTTRLQNSVILGGIGAVLALIPLTSWVSRGEGAEILILWCDVLGTAGMWTAVRASGACGTGGGYGCDSVGLSRLWLDFRDCFGIVWGYRVLERLNQEGERLGWPFRFEIDRIVGTVSAEGGNPASINPDPNELTEECVKQVGFTLGWVFRRFVSEEWMQERLGEKWPIASGSEDESRV